MSTLTLDALLGDVVVISTVGDPASTAVSSVTCDSRAVEPGALFCCIPGATSDGHDFAADAVAKGAVALLCERPLTIDVAQVIVAPGTARAAMASVAATVYGHPSRHLSVIGVTGTNGKTSVTHLVASILDAVGRPTALIGTLGGVRTTPEAPALQHLLANAVADGRVAAAVEVSSHALSLHRVDALEFAVGVFTNLTRDHLDYHGTMADYFAAKATLFDDSRCAVAVVNVDDAWGRRLADDLLTRPKGPRVVEVQAPTETEVTLEGSRFPWRDRTIWLPLVGAFNIENALLAAEATRAVGVPPDAIVAALADVTTVPGRMEVVGRGQDVRVIVDYAHTPAGLTSALATLRAMTPDGRVLCVFGCGGDRDAGKRPLMGAAASAGADVVVLTSDNPRSEAPEDIAADVLAGCREPGEVIVELDRAVAIDRAVAMAESGDVVLVAGKGHESTQIIGDEARPFDDREVALIALARRQGQVGSA